METVSAEQIGTEKTEMGTVIISNAIRNAHTLEAVVEIVNSGTCEGMSEVGGTEFTPEMLAGQYAAEAAREAIWAHLDILQDAGAEFDFSAAIRHALTIANADH